MKVIREEFNEEEINELLELLPNKDMKELQYALEGEGFYGQHLKLFDKKLKAGYFTTFREKEEEIMATLS